MIEIDLSEAILTFDGRVVEVFGSSRGSRRFHIRHLVTAEVKKGSKEARLKLISKHEGIMETIPVANLAEVEQFVAALLEAQRAAS